jgi:hypothetical protein
MLRSRYITMLHPVARIAARRSTVASLPLPRWLPDLTELELPNTMKMDFPDPTNVLSFNLTLTPDEGMSIIFFVFTTLTLDTRFRGKECDGLRPVTDKQECIKVVNSNLHSTLIRITHMNHPRYFVLKRYVMSSSPLPYLSMRKADSEDLSPKSRSTREYLFVSILSFQEVVDNVGISWGKIGNLFVYPWSQDGRKELIMIVGIKLGWSDGWTSISFPRTVCPLLFPLGNEKVIRCWWAVILMIHWTKVRLAYFRLGLELWMSWHTDAANDLAKNRDAFIQNVKNSMKGGTVRGETFDRVLV